MAADPNGFAYWSAGGTAVTPGVSGKVTSTATFNYWTRVGTISFPVMTTPAAGPVTSQITDSDAFTLSEAAQVVVTAVGSDTATVADAAVVTAAASDADAITAADTSALAAAVAYACSPAGGLARALARVALSAVSSASSAAGSSGSLGAASRKRGGAQLGQGVVGERKLRRPLRQRR
jgi:hypothetical protein